MHEYEMKELNQNLAKLTLAVEMAIKITLYNFGSQGYMVYPSRTDDPAEAPDGAVYYNSNTDVFRKRVAGVWSNAGI